MKILCKILNFFGWSQCGYLKLSHGKHELIIETKRTPKHVWITLGENDHPTCSPAGRDTVSVEIVRHGFVIYADIKSNHRTIFWKTY